VWLGRDEEGQGQVYKMGANFNPEILSTQEVAYQISTYDQISDAEAYSYQFEGHEFYVISFPTANTTGAYDASTQEWHQRAHDDFEFRERYCCHVFAMGKHLFGDYVNGDIYELDGSIGTIAGAAIPKERTSPALIDEEKRLSIAKIQLDLEEGTGGTNTDHWMSWSKDGGHTYSNEIARSAGVLGEYGKRLMWRRLGQSRRWSFRYRSWATGRTVLKNLQAFRRGESDGHD